MKKIFAIIMCALIMCALPVVAFAEEEIPDATEEEVTGEETTEEETPPVEEVTPPTEEVTPPTEEVTPPTEGATPPVDTTPELTTEMIVGWVTDNYEEIVVICSVIAAALLIVQRLTLVIKSIITCNNNAAVIAEESKATTQTVLDEVKIVTATVGEYKENVENFLKHAKLANIELANEVAELLVLANIPNSKKEELYARHRAAVDAINAVGITTENTEVKEDVGKET